MMNQSEEHPDLTEYIWFDVRRYLVDEVARIVETTKTLKDTSEWNAATETAQQIAHHLALHQLKSYDQGSTDYKRYLHKQILQYIRIYKPIPPGIIPDVPPERPRESESDSKGGPRDIIL